jgi:uncharacterized membrane protein
MVEVYNFEEGKDVFEETIESWVMTKVDQWRNEYEANYRNKHDEYLRLFRGIWSESDRTRKTERSRIVSPALQQAVESAVAELEEAVFGRGTFFDVVDDKNDPEQQDVMTMRDMMHEDFGKLGTKQAIAEILLNAAIFGEGIGEIVLDTITESRPAEREEGGQRVIGVEEIERTVSKLIPVMPRHFLHDDSTDSLEDMLGCAIDKEVPTHTIEILQERGIYLNCSITEGLTDQSLMADQELPTAPSQGNTRLTKYYGLVPRALLEKAKTPPNSEIVELVEREEEDSHYVEAIVIVADGGSLLKAEENPNMMGDRNVVAFQWDKVPGRFRGRGICEKGYNSAKALDAELRARIDGLGFTSHPMIGLDASRMPRGAQVTVAPGKNILTNGNPSEIIQPFRLGDISQVTFPQAQALQSMVQQATGAVDMAPGNINADQAAASMSMAKGSVLKRHKRTQLNFEENFLVPFIRKVAYRGMQFDPEHYVSRDLRFVPKGNLGIIAREYEMSQIVQLLQIFGDDSKFKPILLEAALEHMSVSNRENLLMAIKQAAQPSPEEQEAAQAAQAAQLAFQQSQTDALNGQAAESMKRAEKYEAEKRAIPVNLENDRLKILASMDSEDDKDFNRRVEIAKLAMDEEKLRVNIPGINNS